MSFLKVELVEGSFFSAEKGNSILYSLCFLSEAVRKSRSLSSPRLEFFLIKMSTLFSLPSFLKYFIPHAKAGISN